MPGHEDHEGNEAADVLAKAVIDGNLVVTDRALPPISYLKREMEEASRAEWKERWRASNMCRVSKLFWPDIDSSRSKKLYYQSRNRLRSFIGIFTGHCMLGKHAKNMRLTDTDECRFCEGFDSVESIEHIFCECPALDRSRWLNLGQTKIDNSRLHLLSDNEIHKFLRSNNILKEIFSF